MKSLTLEMRLLCAAAVCIGCQPEERGRTVTRVDSLGVEVVRVQNLPALDDSDAEWQLNLAFEVTRSPSDPSSTPTLFDPQDGVFLPSGAIVVQDAADFRIVVIDQDSVVRLAPYGHGPGEIAAQGPILVPASDNTFYVVELWGNVRAHHFTAAGELLDDVPLARGGMWPASLGRTPAEITISVIGVGPDRRTTDSVARVDLRTGNVAPFAPLAANVPFEGRGQPSQHPYDLWSTFRDGGAVVGRTDLSYLNVYGSNGELQRVIQLPIAPRPLLDSDKLEIQQAAQELGIPPGNSTTYHSHWRLALRLETVDDTLFAMVHRRQLSARTDPVLEDGREVWRLMSVSGQPKGNIIFPQHFSPWSVGGGRVLGAVKDSLGISTVQVYELRPPRRLKGVVMFDVKPARRLTLALSPAACAAWAAG